MVLGQELKLDVKESPFREDVEPVKAQRETRSTGHSAPGAKEDTTPKGRHLCLHYLEKDADPKGPEIVLHILFFVFFFPVFNPLGLLVLYCCQK